MSKPEVYEPYEPEDRYEQGLAEEHHTDIRIVEEHHAEMRAAAARRHLATVARCCSATLDLAESLTRQLHRRRLLRKQGRTNGRAAS